MQSIVLLVVTALVLTPAAAMSSVSIGASDARVGKMGRWGRPDVSFDFSGFTLAINVSGTEEVVLNMSWNRAHESLYDAQPHQFLVIVDDGVVNPNSPLSTAEAPVGDVPVSYLVAAGLDASRSHVVKVFKITEPNWNSPQTAVNQPQPNFLTTHNFVLRGPSPVANQLVLSATRNIEFIGDSITCGFCNMCKEWNSASGYQAENYLLSWASLTCEAFGANCHTEAWSGYGMYRNVNGNETVTMPNIFMRTCGSANSGPLAMWNFSRWTPHAVVINLGTNDWARGASDPAFVANFTRRYIDFVTQLATTYNKLPKFFLACGPMSSGYCNAVFNVIKKVNSENIASAHFLDMRNLVSNENECCGHPDTSGDIILSNATVATISNVMGWNTIN